MPQQRPRPSGAVGRNTVFFLSQLVFQVPLGPTVTRCASALAATNSATLRLDSVTAPLAFTGPDAPRVRPIMHVYVSNITSKTPKTDQTQCLSSACEEGRYGPDCERECQCDNGGTCVPSTGACECPAGFIGARCSTSELDTAAR